MMKRLIPIMFVLALTDGAQAKCQPTKVETDINAIRLADEQSTERVLGKIDALPFKKPPGSDEDELLLYNRDKTEQAVLTYAAGGYSPGSFEIIEVKKRAPTDLPGKTLDVPKFSTERGFSWASLQTSSFRCLESATRSLPRSREKRRSNTRSTTSICATRFSSARISRPIMAAIISGTGNSRRSKSAGKRLECCPRSKKWGRARAPCPSMFISASSPLTML